jgi:pimeloyl-ACP methyl ester carboxylesterase
VTVVLVHGFPETSAVWNPLIEALDREAVSLALPGLGAPRPDGFAGTKDAYTEWLADTLGRTNGPFDVVGHDIGALLTLRIATALALPLRSWAVDVADIFHPGHRWPSRVLQLQTPGVGEDLLRADREAPADDPRSTVARLAANGAPTDLAMSIGAAHDEVMSRSIIDFYRSAVPNVAADWWVDVHGPTPSRGLVLLLPDPPEVEARSLDVAQRLGAETVRLDNLGHCWMAESPAVVAAALERFWSSLP